MTDTPPIYASRKWTDRTCGYEAPRGNHCPELAVMHVLWTADGENSIDCQKHWKAVQGRWAFVLAHPLDAVCCMPGATWVHAENRCLIEGLDEAVPDLVSVVELENP